MFGKKKDKAAKTPVSIKVDGSDQTIAKVQDMGMFIVSQRLELSKVSTELSARMAQVDSLQQGLDMANGRIAILEGIIANTYNSVMANEAPKTPAPVAQTEAEASW